MTADDAIHAALLQHWKEAIRINTALIALDKTDIDALCRLAFAYMKTGQIASSKRRTKKPFTSMRITRSPSKT